MLRPGIADPTVVDVVTAPEPRVDAARRVGVEPGDGAPERARREAERDSERVEVVGRVHPRGIRVVGGDRSDRRAAPVRRVEDEPARRRRVVERAGVETQHRPAHVSVVLRLVHEPAPGSVDHECAGLRAFVVQRTVEGFAVERLAGNAQGGHPPRFGHVPERDAEVGGPAQRVTGAARRTHRCEHVRRSGKERASEIGVVLEAAGRKDDAPETIGASRVDAAHRAVLDEWAVHPHADLDDHAALQHGFQHRAHEHAAADGPTEHHRVGRASIRWARRGQFG